MTRLLQFLFAVSGCAAALLAAAATPPQGPALPAPRPAFTGSIGTTYLDSRPAFPAPRSAPRGAPNILLVLTDDVGFGAASTFGGPVPTPNLDRLAARGLVYNRFHTTGMCSPTRAALLTGRNHHAVANGIVANLSTGYPGYDNLLPKSAATVAEILRQNGYNTAMFGKHHNAPEGHVSPQGPFDLWPTGLGFDYFFGFMAAQTNQFTPSLYRGVSPVPTLREGVLDEALAEDAIAWLHNQQAVDPDRPFFIYYATGSTHAPLQAPADQIARFRGRFDSGWDEVRAATIARQVSLGLVPRGTRVTPRPAGIVAWSALTPDQRRVSARMMEAYAGMLAYQDEQFGRLLDEIERMGRGGNTLVLFIEGDNGAAAEGGMYGSTNPMAVFANGMQETDARRLAEIDAYGGPESSGNYAYGWAWAMVAPYPYVKSYASHLGAVRNGLVVSWPDRIRSRGIRPQFGQVVDVMPTLLEAAGIEAPSSVNGVAQQPIDGTSFVYTFDAPEAPERHTTQYFEMLGNRAIYHDGWWAGTTPVRIPWAPPPPPDGSPADYAWELYDLRSDPAQARNLAASQPARLAALERLFDHEAHRNGVFPLDDRLGVGRFGVAAAQYPPRDRYTYWGAGISVPAARAAPLLNRSFTIEADLDLPDGSVSGTVLALGSRFGGWSFHLVDGRPGAVMSASQLPDDQFAVVADRSLPAGLVRLAFEFRHDGGRNAGGTMTIRADGHELASGRIARTISLLPEMTDTLDVGFDADTQVIGGPASGPFGGHIRRVDVTYPRAGS